MRRRQILLNIKDLAINIISSHQKIITKIFKSHWKLYEIYFSCRKNLIAILRVSVGFFKIK